MQLLTPSQYPDPTLYPFGIFKLQRSKGGRRLRRGRRRRIYKVLWLKGAGEVELEGTERINEGGRLKNVSDSDTMKRWNVRVYNLAMAVVTRTGSRAEGWKYFKEYAGHQRAPRHTFSPANYLLGWLGLGSIQATIPGFEGFCLGLDPPVLKQL